VTPFPNDPYCYPGTDVLVNHGDYRVQSELNKFEADGVFLALAAMASRPVTGPFDARRLRETHRRIFGNVYPWAGEFRQGIGMMTKERSGFVVTYGPSENVPAALANTFAALTAERDLQGLDAARFASRLAYYYSELDAVHPFREGNSRTLRAFTSDLAESAGHRLDWATAALAADGRGRLYRARDLAVMRGDTSELVEIVAACLDAKSIGTSNSVL
jgi:cell filamentation protein